MAHLRKEIGERTIGYLVAAFGLVAGLAWNEAVKALIEEFVPLESDAIWVKFAYAFIVTVVLVFVSVYLVRLIGAHHDERNEKPRDRDCC